MTANAEAAVLIVGAGPTGLTLACELARRGQPVRIVEQSAGPMLGSRGKGLQPRTLEVFDDLGVIERVLARGTPYPRMRAHLGPFSFRWDMMERCEATEQVPYPNPWMVAQADTEAVLRERLGELGVAVEFGCALTAFTQDGEGVTATLASGAREENARVRYLVGADGGRSFVRKALSFSLFGRTLDEPSALVGIPRHALHRARLRTDGRSRAASRPARAYVPCWRTRPRWSHRRDLSGGRKQRDRRATRRLRGDAQRQWARVLTRRISRTDTGALSPEERTMKRIFRLSTPAAAACFLVVGITGVMMFLHFLQHQVESLHEWTGLAFVAAALLHVLRHWQALTGYARRGSSLQISLSLAAIGVVVFLTAALLGGERGGLDALRVKVQRATLQELAPILDEPVGALVTRLQHCGLQGVTPAATPEQIASASGKSGRDVLEAVAGH